MKTLDAIYGLEALEQWDVRRQLSSDDPRRRDLGDTKQSSSAIRSRPPTDIRTFAELMNVVAFLSVMNKKYVQLYRGQRRDGPLRPRLFREPDPSRRSRLWAELPAMESAVLAVLLAHGLPRWRHLRDFRESRWAVIQHYELSPTPLLDFTTSLRVAASFAFGLDPRASQGFLYVIGVKRIRADLMEFGPPNSRTGDEDEIKSGVLAIRLNAVCPPQALRPHYQEGVLVGSYPIGDAASAAESSADADPILIGKLRLVNRDGGFWNADFPIHSGESLLPGSGRDPLLADFEAAMSDLSASRDLDGAIRRRSFGPR